MTQQLPGGFTRLIVLMAGLIWHTVWQISDRLLHVIRIADTAARRGGDEFALLFVGVQEASEASSPCAKVAQEVGRPLDVDGLKQTPEFSIGYALYPRHGKTLDRYPAQ